MSSVTTAADIYSLGAILYELLAGRAPFEDGTPAELWRRLQEEEARHPRTLNAVVDDDLATIAMKCLEKEPARRYASAAALAEDLERWLAGEPIAARPVGAGERVWRWARRRPALSALAVLTLASLVGGFIGISTQWRRAEHQANLNRINLYAADVALAQQALRESNLGRARRLLDAHRPRPGEDDLRGFEWRLLRDPAQGGQAAAFVAHSNQVRAVVFSPDDRWLVTAGDDPGVRIWDVANRRLARRLDGHTGGANCVAFSKEGRYFASGGQDGALKVWDTVTWQVVTQRACYPFLLAFSPTERVIGYSEGGDINNSVGRVRLWNYLTDERVGVLTNVGNRLAFSTDGKKIIVGTSQRLLIFDRDTFRTVWRSEPGFTAQAIVVSPDGRQFAASSFQGPLRLFDMDEPSRFSTIPGNVSRARSVAFSPDGRGLAAGSGDHAVRLWNVASRENIGTATRTLRGHGAGLRSIAYSPGGRFLASGDKDGLVLLWDLEQRSPVAHVTNVFVSYTSAPPVFSRDSALMSAPSGPEEIAVWDLRTLKCDRLQVFPGARIPLALADDHRTLTALNGSFAMQWWDVASGELRETRPLARPEKAFAAKLSPDGHLLAVGYTDGTFGLWNVDTGQEVWQEQGHRETVREIAFSLDGSRLATASHDATAKVWDIAARRLLVPLTAHKDDVWTVAFSPDGAMLATGSIDYSVRLWTVSDGRPLARLEGHKEGVFRVRFSPDGRTLASASDDGSVRLWHLASRREVFRIDHGAYVKSVEFTPDGLTLVSSAAGPVVHFYRAPSVATLEEQDRRRQVKE